MFHPTSSLIKCIEQIEQNILVIHIRKLSVIIQILLKLLLKLLILKIIILVIEIIIINNHSYHKQYVFQCSQIN